MHSDFSICLSKLFALASLFFIHHQFSRTHISISHNMLINNENDDLIAAFFSQIKRWCRDCWRLRYIITDNFVAEQQNVNLTFKDLKMNKIKVFYILCRKHFKRTLDRKLVDDKYKQTKKHFYDVLYFRKINSKCEKNIKKHWMSFLKTSVSI